MVGTLALCPPYDCRSTASSSLRGAKRRSNPYLRAEVWIASRSLSSGAHSRDPLAPRNDEKTTTCVPAARRARVMQLIVPRKKRAQGMPGADAPAALRASVKSTQASHHRYAETSGIPCAMVLRLIRALPGVPGLIASVALRIIDPGLDPSVGGSGPHAFAVRTGPHRLAMPPRPSHPAPTFRDDRPKRPSCGAGCAHRGKFPKKRKRNIFAEGAGQDSCVIARRANQSIQIAQKKDFLLQP